MPEVPDSWPLTTASALSLEFAVELALRSAGLPGDALQGVFLVQPRLGLQLADPICNARGIAGRRFGSNCRRKNQKRDLTPNAVACFHFLAHIGD